MREPDVSLDAGADSTGPGGRDDARFMNDAGSYGHRSVKD